MAKIVIVEDQTVFLEALKLLIEQNSEHEVVGTFNHPQQFLDEYRYSKFSFDLAILDIRLPEINGLELTKMLVEKQISVKIILLTQYPYPEYVKASVNNGANGYIMKDIDKKELMVAIDSVLDGRHYLCKRATKAILEYDKGENLNMALSPREKQVLIMIAHGKKGKEIAKTMGVKIGTVDYYKSKIKEKLGIFKMSDLTRYAYESGLIDLGSL